MSNPVDSKRQASERPLPRMIRLVRDATADRNDAEEELREVRQVRLEILADELAPVFEDVPVDDSRFDFVISSGLQPRLWIDATAHVAMARDSRTYRFLNDTRLGRTVLAESDKTAPIVEEVTRYVARRIVERQRMLEGRVEPAAPDWGATQETATTKRSRPFARWGEYLSGLMLVILGMIAGVGILIALLSDVLPELFQRYVN